VRRRLDPIPSIEWRIDMDVILLERIARLGQMGDEVRVRDGYARNFLLPQGKALRATDANRKRFESQRTELEARDLEMRSEAEAVAVKLDGQSFVVVRQAGETGQLYGSVSRRDLTQILDEAGFKVSRSQIEMPQPIKTIGLHKISIALHPDVDTSITVNVARSEDEAQRQARGEDLTRAGVEDTEEPEVDEAAVDAEIAEASDDGAIAEENATEGETE
jgi:large subunit ribosomal protein L9